MASWRGWRDCSGIILGDNDRVGNHVSPSSRSTHDTSYHELWNHLVSYFFRDQGMVHINR